MFERRSKQAIGDLRIRNVVDKIRRVIRRYLTQKSVATVLLVFTRPPKLGISMAPNRAQHTVDVTLKVE